MLLWVDSALSYAVMVHRFIGRRVCWRGGGFSIVSAAVFNVMV
jgi:hypothetical protein